MIKPVSLSKIKDKQIIGMEDVLLGFENRFVSVSCCSDKAEILMVNYDYLLKNMDQYHVFDQMIDYCKNRIEFLVSRLKIAITGESKISTFCNNTDGQNEKEMDLKSHKLREMFKKEEEEQFVDQLKELKIISPTKNFVNRSSSVCDQPKTAFFNQMIKIPRVSSIQDISNCRNENLLVAHSKDDNKKSNIF